ncbi:MAG: MBL fold metallo-hydrolase [Candidatus Latescibacteria bacterium]|jgi:glyoxylase-like metal-dependent hydrolase (beta-lactamase superfamily II)|nr:MBL fold metallo-hydrolase [Candidatus Latescibacterota bacterium]
MSRGLAIPWHSPLPDLFCFHDSCNVYLLKSGDEAIAFDFGSGGWMAHLPDIGVKSLRHVFLTHAHRDQSYGLARRSDWPFEVHASAEDARFYRPNALKRFWLTYQNSGCPANYAAPREPLPFVQSDVGDSNEVQWGGTRICPVPTPGHTPGALTYVVNWERRAIAFCGDAVHAGGTVHQPYHLEWDHWTPGGAREAWYGLERLSYCRIDLLCPSHGPMVSERPGACVREARKRLMAFIRSKGSVCAGERDRWLTTELLECGASRVLPDLYHFANNTYLLVGDRRQGFVIDPTLPSVKEIPHLMAEVGVESITAATASHYHCDHSDGLNWLRDRYGTMVWLHPRVAEPIHDRDRLDVPFLPATSVEPDRLLPAEGTFRWNRYRMRSRPFPGQTWWHCAIDTEVSGVHVLFSGDCFQPPSRWNGTGGFCAYNGSRFSEGFAPTVQDVLDLGPELICNGHSCIYRYHPGHYRRILRWSSQAERSVQDLCASDPWTADYDHRATAWCPFRSSTRPGSRISLRFQFRNLGKQVASALVRAVVPEGWRGKPETRRARVPAGRSRRTSFEVSIPRKARKGRYVLAAEVHIDGQLIGEPAVALVDVV